MTELTKLQLMRQRVSEARRVQLAAQDKRATTEINVTEIGARRYVSHCNACGREFQASQRNHARGKLVDHLARDHS